MRSLMIMFCLLVGRVASAGEATGVVVTGGASLQPQLLAHLETWLRTRGEQVVPSPLPADAISALVDCFVLEDDACAKRVIDTHARSRVVVYVRVDASSARDGSRSLQLTAYRFTKGGDATADRRFCERCSEEALASTAAELMSALVQSAHATTGSLRLGSTPAGAKVVIAGGAVGITPLVHDLAPGEHLVTLVLDNYDVESRTAVVRAGETTTIEVALSPARREPRRRTVPAVLALGGLAAVATGVTLLAIDEDHSPTGPPEIRNTAPAGVVVAGAGALAFGAGIWLWLRAGRADAAPVSAVSRDTAYLGWSTSF